jgi:hypothetical protein
MYMKRTKAQIEALDKVIDEYLAMDEWEPHHVEILSQLTLSKAQLVSSLAEQWSVAYRDGTRDGTKVVMEIDSELKEKLKGACDG